MEKLIVMFCLLASTPGGYIAKVGVHGKPVEFQLQGMWIQYITLKTGLVNTTTTPMLSKVVLSGRINPNKLITHHFKLKEMLKVYDVFGNVSKEKAMKVMIES